MALRIHQSNRLEILADLLAEQLRTPLQSPLAPEPIIVQSRGLARWLSLELARRNGICANCAFPFPGHFLRDLAAGLSASIPADDPYAVDIMTARLMKLLPGCLGQPEFAELSDYLSDDPTQEKYVQLATRIAELFDQYMVFRPEMILSWDQGVARDTGAHRWQSILWRKLVHDTESPHRVALQRRLIDDVTAAPRCLPERLTLFAVTSLPPFHLTVLTAVSQVVPVTLYYLNPCREYWADILTDAETQRIVQRHPRVGAADDLYYLEGGHPLLATLGKLGREFQHLVGEVADDIHDHFQEPPRRSLLTRLQADILNLKDPVADAPPDEAGSTLECETPSIRINACHSRMREMEVLYDQMLAWFDQEADLTPSDIVVMAPDIENYVPYVQAVFGTPTREERIPFSIADRPAVSANPICEAFTQLLELRQSRLGAAQVMALLDIPAVQARWQFSDTEVDTAAEWIENAGIRWGVDAAHRRELGFGDSDDNTWEAGLRRLMLGYAMADRPPGLYAGIVPADRIEGRDAVLLGKIQAFVQRVIELSRDLGRRQTLEQWRQCLLDTLEGFIQAEAGEQEAFAALQRGIVDLGGRQEQVGLDRPLTIQVVRHLLERILNRPRSSTGFLSGGVTFCALMPMRSIPFEVVCLVGMNHDAFPRQSAPVGFDLIQRHPRIGDRSRRKDDMHMFLEAVLSARRTLYISYIGRDKQDNSAKPPSVLVGELVDILDRGYGMAQRQAVCVHRLQAFSPDYFRPSAHRLFSYSSDNLAAARALIAPSATPPAFLEGALTAPPADFKRPTLTQLCRFYGHPARYLLQSRLEIYLDDQAAVLDDSENFRLEGLERFRTEQSLFEALVNGDAPEVVYRRLKSMGSLPHGNVGRMIFDRMCAEAVTVVEKADRLRGGDPLPVESISLEIDGFCLTARLAELFPPGQVLVRYKHLTPKDMLAAWIHHLVYCSGPGHGHRNGTFLVCKDRVLCFDPPDRPDGCLSDLLQAYRDGLVEPLPFFPQSSHTFATQRLDQGKPLDAALRAARQAWAGNDHAMGEGQEAYFDLCFRQGDPFDQRFQQIALAVFRPLKAHMRPLDDTDPAWRPA